MPSSIDNFSLFELAEQLLKAEHRLSYKLKGNSMFPVLREGDVATVEICEPKNLKKGDVVVFNAGMGLVAHRIIKKELLTDEFIFYTRGDNSKFTDKPFHAKSLLGIIRNFERNGKKKSLSPITSVFRMTNSPALQYFNLKINNILFRFRNLKTRLISLNQNLKLILTGSQKSFTQNVVISILQGILPFALIICLKYLTDILTSNQPSDIHSIIFYLLITGIVFFLSGILTEIKVFSFEKLSHSVHKFIHQKLHTKHSGLELTFYENPEEQDKIHRAVQEASFRPSKIINGILNAIKSVVSAIFLAGIFVSIKWYLILVLLLAVIPELAVRVYFSRKYYHLKKSQSAQEREMYYHNRVLTGFPFAKEQKLFGFSAFFQARFNALQNTLFDTKYRLRKSEITALIFSQLFAVILIFGALFLVAYMKIRGLITIGTVVLFLFAFQRGYSVLNELFRSFTQMVEDNTYLNDFIAFLNLQPKRKTVKSDAEISLKNEIKIQQLSFSYETSKRPALNHINLSIPVGKTVALVGPNGSGKSTLIKLLCGFYQPDEGLITFDGTNIADISGDKIRRKISAVFQDFALYNVSAMQNIVLGRIENPLDEVKAKSSAEIAGIAGILEKLPNGYNTLLGNLFEGSEELSIGQWQKLAIARAFYRDAPLLLLDEPSSALDVESEKQIIHTLKKLAENKTAVIVSHRMSTVQWADIIYLLENGEVKESGSHTELMNLNGKYAELYRTTRDIDL